MTLEDVLFSPWLTLYLLCGCATLRWLMEIGPELYDGSTAPTTERYYGTVALWPLCVAVVVGTEIWVRVLGRK